MQDVVGDETACKPSPQPWQRCGLFGKGRHNRSNRKWQWWEAPVQGSEKWSGKAVCALSEEMIQTRRAGTGFQRREDCPHSFCSRAVSVPFMSPPAPQTCEKTHTRIQPKRGLAANTCDSFWHLVCGPGSWKCKRKISTEAAVSRGGWRDGEIKTPAPSCYNWNNTEFSFSSPIPLVTPTLIGHFIAASFCFLYLLPLPSVSWCPLLVSGLLQGEPRARHVFPSWNKKIYPMNSVQSWLADFFSSLELRHHLYIRLIKMF